MHRLKTSTMDVVDSGDADKFRKLANSLSNDHVDVFERGKVWFNPLPEDYVSAAVGYGSFINMKLYALSIPDIIIKAARLSGNDWRDIVSCRESTTWVDLVQRFGSYPKNNSVQQNNIRKILINIFGAPPDDVVKLL